MEELIRKCGFELRIWDSQDYKIGFKKCWHEFRCPCRPDINFDLSFEEYVKHFGGDDGYHWNSKVNTGSNACFSRYPTMNMLATASEIIYTPFPAYLARAAYYKYNHKRYKTTIDLNDLVFELQF
jgi:hypothetical protein